MQGSHASKSQPWTQKIQYCVTTGMTSYRPAVRSTCASCQLPLQGPVKRRGWQGVCTLPFRNVWLLWYTEITKEILESIHSDTIFNVMNVVIKIRLKRRWLDTAVLYGSATFTFILPVPWAPESQLVFCKPCFDTHVDPPKETWAFH